MSDPAVTAILATLGRPSRLSNALQSVFKQTYDGIRVVVVEAGASRDVRSVVETFEERSAVDISHIRNETQRGLATARNNALSITDTKYVAFLDDDDEWLPRKTEQQVRTLEEAPDEVRACYGGEKSVTDDGRCVHQKHPRVEGDIRSKLLVQDIVGTPSTVLVERSAVNSIDGFDESLSQREDWDLYIRLSRSCEFACVSRPLIRRGTHDEQMSWNVGEQRESTRAVLSKHESEMRRRGVWDNAWSRHHHAMGVKLCRLNRPASARRAFRRSLTRRVSWRTVWLYLLVRFAGVRGFEAFDDVAEKVDPDV